MELAIRSWILQNKIPKKIRSDWIIAAAMRSVQHVDESNLKLIFLRTVASSVDMDGNNINKMIDNIIKYLNNESQNGVIDLLTSRYGAKEIEEQTGFRISELKQGRSEAFSQLLSSYSGDVELRNFIWRCYSEFGCALQRLGISAPSHRDLMEGWDDKSKAILWHLSQRRHADIEELSEAVCITHYEVLSRLKEIIIPESKKIFGESIVRFEKSKMDNASGEKICFSWWMVDEIPVLSKGLELFNEGDRVLIVAGLPNVKLQDPIDVSARYKNGILEVAIKK